MVGGPFSSVWMDVGSESLFLPQPRALQLESYVWFDVEQTFCGEGGTT
jgi:hypothetical protein